MKLLPIIIVTIGISSQAIAEEPIKPNIIIIISDSARTDHFSSYGYERETTPQIDAFAKEGALFSYCISHGNWTSPGLASLYWGTYAINHYNSNENAKDISGKVETPVVLLRNYGYKIAGYGHSLYQRDVAIDSLNDKAAVSEWLDKNKESPFLLFYRTHITHIPYNPAPPYNDIFLPDNFIASNETLKNMDPVRTYWIVHDKGKLSRAEANGSKQGIADFSEEDKIPVLALYDGKLKMLDDEVGELIKKVDEAGLKDKTIVVFTGEHGEELLDRNHVGHAADSLDASLNDELIRVPLIIRYPPLIPKNIVIDRQVELVDIMPTALDMAGTKRLDYFSGESFLSLLKEGPEKYTKEYAFSFGAPAGCQNLPEDRRMLRSVRTERWKLIALEDIGKTTYELYDLKKDPNESRDIIGENVEVAAGLKKVLDEWYTKAKANGIFYKE